MIDESADARLAGHLVELGHDATFIAQSHRPGLADARVLAIAHQEARILITDDRDFGELVFRHRRPHAGVIFFRLSPTLPDVRIARLDEVLARYSEELAQFPVVTERSIRVRRAPSP